MELKQNVVGWFEIPVSDMSRAVKFYESVFSLKLQIQKLGELEMAWFPWVESAVGAMGSLVYSPGNYKPSNDGVLVYFTAFSGDVSNELAAVEKAGGKILKGKTLIADDIGYMALFQDTEGNRIAIHSRK